ncbi:hypothetical protein BDC45DRAFT_424003, partial [Circinella umbellata]
YVAVFFFLNVLYSSKEYPGPHDEIEKGLFLLYQSDSKMFLNMSLYKFIDKKDLIAVDGGFTLFINQFEEICQEKGFDFNDNNFINPIRKEKNVDLNIQEKHFNKLYGSFRSLVENQFCEIHNKCKRFSNNNALLKATDYDIINLQFKTACLLKNIYKFCNLFSILTQPHHKLWENEDFEFPSEEKLIDLVYSNEMKTNKKLLYISELQKDIE